MSYIFIYFVILNTIFQEQKIVSYGISVTSPNIICLGILDNSEVNICLAFLLLYNKYCSHQLMECLYLTYEMNFFWRNDCKTITIVIKLLTLIEGFLCSRHYTKSFTPSHFVLTSVFCSKYYHCQFTFGKNETKFKQHTCGCTSS